MSPIPDDDNQEVKESAEWNARRAAAALAGAIEGFLDAVDEYDLGGSVEESAHVAGDLARETSSAMKHEADTPEFRAAGEKARDIAIRTGEKVSDVKDAVASKASDARDAVRAKVDDVKDAAHNAKEGAKVRAEAIGESGRRAKAAPRRVGRELSGAFRAWRKGIATSLAMYGLIAVVALTTWILLTITLVVALNKLLFDPLGTFLVVVIYAIVAGIALGVAKSRKAATQREVDRRMARSREEVRRVGRPVREAFAGRGRAGF